MGEKKYSSTVSLTSTQDGGWPAPRPRHITPGNAPYMLYRRLGGHQGRSGWVRKNLVSHRDSIPGPSSP